MTGWQQLSSTANNSFCHCAATTNEIMANNDGVVCSRIGARGDYDDGYDDAEKNKPSSGNLFRYFGLSSVLCFIWFVHVFHVNFV